MKKVLVALLFLLVITPVYAEKWVKVTPDIYVDSHSFYKTGINSAGMTFRVRNYNYYANDEGGVLGEGVLYRIDKVEADCDKKLVRFMKSTSYGEYGQKLAEEISSPYGPVSPNTLGETYLNGICYMLKNIK